MPRVAKNESKKLQETTVSGEIAQISAPAKNRAVMLSPRPPKNTGSTPNISIIVALVTDGESPASTEKNNAPAIMIKDLAFLRPLKKLCK